jgi:hypothetical protein
MTGNRMLWNMLALAGMLVTFSIAHSLDRWIEGLRADAAQSFDFLPVAANLAVANLILAVCLIVLAWLVSQRPTTWLIGLIYIVAGLLVTLGPAVALARPALRPSLAVFATVSPISRVEIAAAFIAVIGVYGVLMSVRRDSRTLHDRAPR